MYTNICIYIYILLDIHIHTYVPGGARVEPYVGIQIHTYVPGGARVEPYVDCIYINQKTYIDIHLYTFIYLHTYMCIHTYTYTYSYTYKYIYQAVPGLSHMSFWSSLSRVRAVSNGSSRSIPNSYIIWMYIKYMHIHVRVYIFVSLCKFAPCLTARLDQFWIAWVTSQMTTQSSLYWR